MNKIFNDIVTFYNLGKIINEPIQLSGGITNKVYKIDTDKSCYIIKILSTTDINKFELSEEIANIALNNNINALGAIKCNEKYVNTIDDINVAVYPYYDGKVLLTKELTLEHIKMLANSLARLHSIKIDKKVDIIKYKKNDFEKLYSLLTDNECFDYFRNNYNLINKIYNKVYDSYNKLSNNYSYVHKDFNRKNVLWKDMDFKIIDWESSNISNPGIDLFNSVWFLSNDIQEDKFNVFIDEYFNINKINDDLKKCVYAALIEELNWLNFSLERALKINTSDEYEIKLGEDSIKSSVTEIINYYNKIELMLNLLEKKNYI